MSLEKPKTLRKYLENLQHQTPQLQFLKTLIFPRALSNFSILSVSCEVGCTC